MRDVMEINADSKRGGRRLKKMCINRKESDIDRWCKWMEVIKILNKYLYIIIIVILTIKFK